ncbi:MAG: Cation transport ATPase [Parcubacteria group bacterium GW2011_GWB1_46_8]|nr:MAG: Cation transport ATPase [Parcubacteria group bacterium GW2011_GWF1_45_5]KKU43242.1 MAG: Cation transport ATPase [Parcubacteria group bacterium GW2011_GWA2_46_7]KKU45948.1 MAG: Cation transport ATPase [Parcubacteria group bacterium GW2011_GWB1_46_8]
MLNAVLGFFQERKASRALFALKRYIVAKAVVWRDGGRATVDVSTLVPGDVVVLNQGNKIPADGILFQANRLQVDESILTGESISVKKTERQEVFMGTVVTSGQGLLRVEKTGADTQIGAIALQIQKSGQETPLQKQLGRFSKQLLFIIGFFLIVVLIAGVAHDLSFRDIFTTSVALAVSSVPEGLIVSLTVVLAIGMQRILKRKGLVKSLVAAETLGGATVICSDKTGTLTEGNLKVTDVAGDEEALIEQILLVDDVDDPIMVAALNWAKGFLDVSFYRRPQVDSIPFSSERRHSLFLHEWSKSHNRMYVSGAPELLLGRSTLSVKEKEAGLSRVDAFALQGKRLLGFAYKDLSCSQRYLTGDESADGLVWVGMLAFADQVRESAQGAVALAQSAGIRIIVITGDHVKTSEFVLSQVGISLGRDETIVGSDIEGFSSEDLARIVGKANLFARTTPSQKLRIIEALKHNGEVVAMMGDGVNDAPALHRADIGIVVSEATDVAKESADLVLLDSNFSTIIAAIEEGRAMFENIRKVILYLLSDSFSEILVVLGGLVLGFPLPLTAAQILWVNLVSDGFPGLALTVDAKRQGIMSEKPRSPREPLVARWMILLIVIVSTIAGLLALGSFIITYRVSGDITVSRSMAFLVLGLNSLVYVFSVRSLTVPFWKHNLFGNKWLMVAVAAGFILQVLPFVLSPMRDFFGVVILPWQYWVSAIFLSVLMFFIVEVFKHFLRLNHHD